LLGVKVLGIDVEEGRIAGVVTDRGTIRCRYVINAAGLYADEVAAMAGPREFTIHPRLGELIIFDPRFSGQIRSSLGVFSLAQDSRTKGGGISVTVDGNMEWGPTAEEVPCKDDHPTSLEGMSRIIAKFQPLLPAFEANGRVIAAFAGLRAATYTEDFHIRPSDHVHGLFNVAGIQSPGLASAPAIAEMVIEQMRECGVAFREKPGFDPIRKQPVRFADLSHCEKQKWIAMDPAFGRMVCRCEGVTEGEIVAAIHRPVPALTVDAVKRRTRAGMGRCQGGYCLPRVSALLARELGIPMTMVTKDGPGSELFWRASGHRPRMEGKSDAAS
jgi:glycerol-3-phosphate dehydrogenase